MALKITADCVSCGACEPVCPNLAISPGDDVYVIDPAKCTECYGWHAEQQCASVCPTDACLEDPEHRETKEQLLEKFKALNPGKEPEATDQWQPLGRQA